MAERPSTANLAACRSISRNHTIAYLSRTSLSFGNLQSAAAFHRWRAMQLVGCSLSDLPSFTGDTSRHVRFTATPRPTQTLTVDPSR